MCVGVSVSFRTFVVAAMFVTVEKIFSVESDNNNGSAGVSRGREEFDVVQSSWNCCDQRMMADDASSLSLMIVFSASS